MTTIIPIFKWANKLLSPAQAVPNMLAPFLKGMYCKTTPRCAIGHNVTFLVNKTYVKHEEDIKSDDIGAWRNNGVHKHRFGMVADGDLSQLDDDDMQPREWVTYILRRL